MRIFSALALLTLAACSDKPESATSLAEAETQAARSSAEDGRISCATTGDDRFAADCEIEQEAGPEGTILTIRHPDGGFRRLEITKDGRGVIAADGAETAIVKPVSNGLIEVQLGDARYRLPATIKPGK
jgi:hypothetical protein